MKKLYMILAGMMFSAGAFAQSDAEPNRLLLNSTTGSTQGYVLDRVSDVTFARVDGEVKAETQIHNVTADGLTMSVTRTPECMAFKLDILPRSVANMLKDDASMVSYINSRSSVSTYNQDFENATLTGVEFSPGGDYTLVTIGIDAYNCEDGVCREDFTAPSIPVVGNPQVTATLTDATLTSFTVEFVPNSDVSTYYTVAGEKGTMQAQYEQFGPMFGFASMNDLIMGWGLERSGTMTNTWNDMAPNTDYEIFILALDKNGNPAPYQIFDVRTQALGGEGEALVDITLGDYKLADWYGEMKPSQFMTFTPNDQASCFRFGVYLEEQYDSDADAIKADLCSDPPMPMAYWFFYEPTTTDYQIDPGQNVVAIAAAKNVNGEWGKVNEFRFTTPATAPTSAPASGVITPRIKSNKLPFSVTPGKLPELRTQTRLQLK